MKFAKIMVILLVLLAPATSAGFAPIFGGDTIGEVMSAGTSRTDRVQGMAESVNLNARINARKRMSKIMRRAWHANRPRNIQPNVTVTSKRAWKRAHKAQRHAEFKRRLVQRRERFEKARIWASWQKTVELEARARKRASRKLRAEKAHGFESSLGIVGLEEDRSHELNQLRAAIEKRAALARSAKAAAEKAARNRELKEEALKYRKYFEDREILKKAIRDFWRFAMQSYDLALLNRKEIDFDRTAEYNGVPVAVVFAAFYKYNMSVHNRRAARAIALEVEMNQQQ